MPGIDDVLERLVTDPGFRTQLATDPKSALADYDLTADDLTLLATTISDDEGGESGVERRESKAGFVALFSELAGGGGGRGGTMPSPGEDVGFNPQPDPPHEGFDDIALGGPDTRPGDDVAIGGPDTRPGEDRGIIING